MGRRICVTRKPPARHHKGRLSHVFLLGADCDTLDLGQKKRAGLEIRDEKTRASRKR